MERILRRLLQVVVDRETQVMPLDGRRLADRLELPADAVHNDAPDAVGSHQQVVVGMLDAGMADDVAAPEPGVALER